MHSVYNNSSPYVGRDVYVYYSKLTIAVAVNSRRGLEVLSHKNYINVWGPVFLISGIYMKYKTSSAESLTCGRDLGTRLLYYIWQETK